MLPSTVSVPYYCAKGNVMIATTTCMPMAYTINVASLIDKAEEWSGSDIDNVAGIAGDKVYLFHGTEDSTVNNGQYLNAYSTCLI